MARTRPAAVARAHVVALVMACVVEIGLRLSSLPVLSARLGVPLDLDAGRSATQPPEATAANLTRRQRLRIRAIDRVLQRWPFGDTCLRRALINGYTLRSRSPVLRIGAARNDDGDVLAHAWIEFDGLALGTSTDHGYRALQTPNGTTAQSGPRT